MKHLAIIGMVLPEPNSTAAGKRMMQLIDYFKDKNYKISFLCAAQNVEYSEDLTSHDIQVFSIMLNHSSFEETIKSLQPDVVLYDRFVTEEQYGWKMDGICPNAIKILDTEDLHFLRHAREKAYKKGEDVRKTPEITGVFKREMASILRCDLSLIISEFEYQLLQNHYSIAEEQLCYLPLFATKNPLDISFAERKNFVSIGNFLHEPNWQTVLKLKKLWPEIRKRIPNSQLHIYGAYVTEKAQQLHQPKQGFYIMGRAQSVDEVFMKSKVLLAPIPYGAGIKGKLLDAMRCGLPSVTSPMGAEAMHGKLPWNGFVCETDNDFIDKSVLLYTDNHEWQKAKNNGYTLVEKRYNKAQFYPILSQKILAIEQDISSFRNRNFLGQLLRHHTLQSSKYLGKWIEEKNKNRE